jgi:hypothetical protein
MNAVALVLGGSEDVFSEYETARAICKALGLPITVFVINDVIPTFPGDCQVVTMHPEKLERWLAARAANGHPAPSRVWAHTLKYPEVTDFVRDWAGSSGLTGIVVPRLLGFKHIILCGIPMNATPHITRKTVWEMSNSYWRMWERLIPLLPPQCVRSMSGRTRDRFGFPDVEWLKSDIVVGEITQRPPLQLKA